MEVRTSGKPCSCCPDCVQICPLDRKLSSAGLQPFQAIAYVTNNYGKVAVSPKVDIVVRLCAPMFGLFGQCKWVKQPTGTTL